MGAEICKAYGIIGAGWGDEGKGLATDALTAQLVAQGRKVTVARSNGGAQAGHGVTMADGRHHVFHHISSGSFQGATTHLSRFFVSHPMVFLPEFEDLKRKGVTDIEITADPRSTVTTPWDMAINQAVEITRGGGKHGSCGLGFGETLERHENGPKLTMDDLSRPDLKDRVLEIA
jgi:adenylosuccinate synthase